MGELMTILNHIWPWSRIAKLEAELEAERQRHDRTDEFASSCLAYLNRAEGDAFGIKFIRFNDELYILDADSVKRVHRVPSPRSNFIITGITAPGSEG